MMPVETRLLKRSNNAVALVASQTRLDVVRAETRSTLHLVVVVLAMGIVVSALVLWRSLT